MAQRQDDYVFCGPAVRTQVPIRPAQLPLPPMRYFPLLLLGLAGCASVPDTTLYYYPTKTKTTVTVTHAIACSSDLKHYAVASKAETATVAMADMSKKPFELNTKKFKNQFGSTGLTINFKEDGRLSGFNADGTGAGGEIVKTVVGVVTGRLPTAKAEALDETPTATEICAFVKKFGEKNVLNYVESAFFESPSDLAAGIGGNLMFKPTKASEAIQDRSNKLKDYLPVSSATFSPSKTLHQVEKATNNTAGQVVQPIQADGQDFNQFQSVQYPTITLRPVQLVELVVTVKAFMGAADPLPSVSLVVPATGEIEVPVAKTGFFGSNETEITLSDVGAITKIHYGAKDAVTAGLSAVNTVIQSTAARTPAQEAADLNSQADVIAAATRLANCRANPEACKPAD